MPPGTVTPRAIVTDVEGTTTSLAFVHEVLFPYSHARLADFVAAHTKAVAPILNEVRAQANDPTLPIDRCVALLLAWHEQDLKISPLKTIQGLIWAEGFETGDLKGHVYADAVAGLRRWHGSVAAQKLLFGHTNFGDLTSLFSGYFDTSIGGKKDANSYRAIAKVMGLPPADILFLSDVDGELVAAQDAGFAVTILSRERLLPASRFPVASTFDPILPG